MMSIGDIAVAPSNPNIVWVGTGEANNRQSSSWGDGVYKSTDAGRTWTRAGLADTRHIGRIVVHPANPDVVYVAATGHLWGPNSERGVFKTIDGGKTWSKSLYVDDNTGATDLVIDPRDPQTLVRGDVPAAAEGVGLQRRRSRQRHLSHTRRRRDVDAGCPTGCRRATKGASGSTSSTPIRASSSPSSKPLAATTASTAARMAATPGRRGRPSTRGRCTSARSAPIRRTPRASICSDRTAASTSRTTAARPSAMSFSTIHSEDHALWIDPDDTEPPDHRRRRRRLDLVGPRPDVAVPRQPAGRPVLRDQRRHAGPVRDLRRAAGQRPLVRAERDAPAHRHLQPRRLQHRQRRRLLRAAGSDRSAHGDHRVAGRPRQPGQPVDARAAGGVAAAAGPLAERRTRALELEHADRHVELRSKDDLHGLARGLQVAGPRRDVEGDQSRPHRQRRSRVAGDDGRPRARARAVAPRRRHRRSRR